MEITNNKNKILNVNVNFNHIFLSKTNPTELVSQNKDIRLGKLLIKYSENHKIKIICVYKRIIIRICGNYKRIWRIYVKYKYVYEYI